MALKPETRKIVLARIAELEAKALARLARLENSGALAGDESAGLIMADITAELASGYRHSGRKLKNLRRF